MRDEKISLPRIMLLHPLVRGEVLDLINKAEAGFPQKIKIRVVQGLRTFDEQAELFALGRTKKGSIVTNAKPGQSYHNFGLAIDFALMYDLNGDGTYETLSWDVNKDLDKDGVKDWMEVVNIFEGSGWTWGGRWTSMKDDPHFEKRFGYSHEGLLAKYNRKEWVLDSLYVKI